MWSSMAAKRKIMPLSRVDRERITDSVLKIQSVRAQLDHLDESKLSEVEEIKDCLENADDNMRDALKSSPPKK
jgi:hypothetical protein